MNDFRYWNYTDIRMGRGVEKLCGELLATRGKKVLLHYGGGSIKRNGLYDTVTASLNASGLDYVELGGVQPNPRLSLIHQGVELCRREGVDCILAVGGGSVIDSAKAISWGVNYPGDVWDFLLGADFESVERLPLCTIPTLPAAGSEDSLSMVISNTETEQKLGRNHPRNRPEWSLLNPELTYSLPPFQTACGVVDMLAHVMERYFTNTDHVDLTDRMCEAVMRSVLVNGPIAMVQPDNYDARAELMWAAATAHNDVLGLGRTQAWACHRLEHELSAFYDVAHGAGLSVIFPAWMKFFCRKETAKFLQFAQRVMDVSLPADQPEDIMLAGIHRLEQFYRTLNMPTRLAELNIDDSRFSEMARRVAAFSFGRQLTPEECLEIYRLAL